MTEWHFPHQERRHALAGILLVVLLLGGGPLLALEGTIPSGAVRHEVIPLSHIGPERGREFLVRLKIGTASQLPGTNTLLVTGDPGELQKAVAILGVVDNRTEFDIRQLGHAWDARKMPSNQQIADAVGGISIGTFANPPRDNTKKRGIIDVHNGAVVVIAPVALLADIQTAVESGPEVLKQRRALAGPSNPPSTAPTIQAVAMADPAAAAAGGAGKPSSSLNDERLPSPAEMQARLEEMRRRALELKAQQQAAQLAAQPATPAPAANPPQVDGNVPPVDPNADQATEPLPGGLQQVGAPRAGRLSKARRTRRGRDAGSSSGRGSPGPARGPAAEQYCARRAVAAGGEACSGEHDSTIRRAEDVYRSRPVRAECDSQRG
jgi:hypothetical protein